MLLFYKIKSSYSYEKNSSSFFYFNSLRSFFSLFVFNFNIINSILDLKNIGPWNVPYMTTRYARFYRHNLQQNSNENLHITNRKPKVENFKHRKNRKFNLNLDVLFLLYIYSGFACTFFIIINYLLVNIVFRISCWIVYILCARTVANVVLT